MVLMAILQRWLSFGWVGRLASLAVALYGLGWIFGTLGADGAARQLGSAGLYVLAFPLTWLFIRMVWGLSKKPGR